MDNQNNLPKTAHNDNEEASPLFLKHLQIRIIVVAIAILLILLVIFAAHLWLMLFASVLFAIMLKGIGNFIMYLLPLESEKVSNVWEVVAATALIIVVMTVAVLFLGPRLGTQLNDLSTRLPEGIDSFQSAIRDISGIGTLLDALPSTEQITSRLTNSSNLGVNIIDGFTGIVSTTFGVLLETFIIIVVGFYFALSPSLYVDNFLRLFPQTHRARLRDVLSETKVTLRNWLLARLASVIVVIILTIIGLMILGMPLVLTLAIIAGVLSFIPNLGPVLGAIPAIIIAFTISPSMVLAIIVLYTIIQTIESYFVTPSIEQYTLSLPPALVVMMQVFSALFLGFLGVFLAAPLLATIIVLIKELYIEDVLGDPVDKLVQT